MLLDDYDVIEIFSLVVILLLILLIISLVNRVYADDYPKTAEYIQSIEMNNGDLVCVSYPNFAGGFVTSFSRSIWSHTGTIWVDPISNIRYVLEGAIYKHNKYKHFIKIPLETWLYFNRKSIIAYKKYIGPAIDSNFIDSIYQQYNNCKLEGFNFLWARFLFDKDYYEYTKNSKLTCLEFTVILDKR